jgi:hypothetical protein
MSTDETVSFSLEINVEEAMVELRKAQTALFRLLGLLRKHFGDDRFDAVISKIMELITVINQARLALAALQIAMAGAGPVGWLLAGVGVLSAISSADTLMRRPRY